MSDEEDGAGFGEVSEEEEDTGFGGADEDEEDGDGFGELDEDEEDGDGFGDGGDEDDEDGGGFDSVETAAKEQKDVAKLETVKVKDDTLFPNFSKKYFQNGNTGSYQLEPIKLPLLKISQNMVKPAAEVFVHICRWCGITAKVGKGSLGTLDTAAKIIEPGIRDEELRDEAYCQLMKQLTDNPSKQSRARGVILLTLMLGCFAPSSKLLPTLRKFIADGPPGYIPYQELLLKRTLFNGTRKEPPCSLELASAKRKQIMRVQVTVDLVTGRTSNARLDSASVSNEWVQEIAVRERITNPKGYAIFINRFGRLESLYGAGGKQNHIMDAISKIDRAHRKEAKKSGAELDNDVLNSISGQLSLRKEYFDPSGIPNSDSVGVDVTCHQIQYGIKLGIFAFTDDSDYDFVAALSYYIEYGDEVDEKDMTTVIEEYTPPSALARQSAKQRLGAVSKLHAKGDYSRKGMSRVESQQMLIKKALEQFGRLNSFSSDGSKMLVPNGKSEFGAPAESKASSSTKKKSTKKKK